ncbi:hypothetical protein BJ741DRAFT_709065 [Chytriomyces cf. hyalinus JEL632]|nr:hypothetical protein BJ741DRAFT_709065 [Chytriomyces cf. hyalinus JEL632]
MPLQPVALLPGDVPFNEANRVNLDSLTRWLQDFEDEDAKIDELNQSFLDFSSKTSQNAASNELTKLKIPILRLDPHRTTLNQNKSQNAAGDDGDAGERVAFKFLNELEEEAQLRKAVKRTRFLLSRLESRVGSSHNQHSPDQDCHEIMVHNPPLYELAIRPASSHVHRKSKLESFKLASAGVLHLNDTTAIPLLNSGWTWKDVPMLKEGDVDQQNVYSLVTRGYVPQGTDVSPLVRAFGQRQLMETIKSKLNPRIETEDPKDKYHYAAFEEKRIPHMLRINFRQLTPLPEIIQDKKLHAEIASLLGVDRNKQQERAHRIKLASTNNPPNLTRKKPSRPQELICRVQEAHRLQPSSVEPIPTPPATRQTSAYLRQDHPIEIDPSSYWIIFIKSGSAVTTSVAYLNFKAKNISIWPQIRHLIWKLEVIMQRYAVPCAEVKCAELIRLGRRIPADSSIIHFSTLQKLLLNASEVGEIIKTPGQVYRGIGYESNENLAAVCIQAAWRAHVARGILATYYEQKKATIIIIRSWRLKKFRTKLYQQIMSRFESQHKKRFYRIQAVIAKDWKEMTFERKKVIVQMAPRFTNAEVLDTILGRVILLLDQTIETLILVIPFLTREKEDYISMQLDQGFLDDNPLKTGRLKLISPCTAKSFVYGSSVAAILKCCHKSMALLKSMIEGKLALLMTDHIGRAEIGLCSHLNIALLGSKPEKLRNVSTREKSMLFLQGAGIEVAPGITFNRGLELDLALPLLRVRSQFPDVAVWEIFEKRKSGFLDFARPDHVCDACVDADKLPKLTLSELQTDDGPWTETLNLSRAIKTKRCPSYVELISRLCGLNGPATSSSINTKGTGGYIQACPVRNGTNMRRIEVGFFIEFTGTPQHLVTAEAILDTDFEQVGLIIPQQRMPHHTILRIVDRLVSACVLRGIFGFVTIQLAAWHDIMADTHGWWATHFYPFLSPSILKACSVVVSTGCPIDPRTGISSFHWTDIPLHLEKTHHAIYVNHPQLRKDFENTIRKQAGGATEQRVAIYADNLRNAEVDRMTWRGFVFSSQKDGIRFNEKIRKGSYFPFVDPCMLMRMPIVTVGADYKSTIEAFLKDLTLSHRRLKHYDVLDLISNIRDTARFFIQEWRNLDTKPQMFLSVVHEPAHLGSIPRSSVLARGASDASKALKTSGSYDFNTTSSQRAIAAKILERAISSDEEDADLTEESPEKQLSVEEEPGNVTAVTRTILTRGKQVKSKPAQAPIAKPPVKKPVYRLADKLHPRAWWDTPLFTPTDPYGTIHHLDPYDPQNASLPINKHFELDPAHNRMAAMTPSGTNTTDLDDLVSNSGIPSLAKLTSSKRPVTSLSRQIQNVMDEIEKLKRPPPPPKAQRTTLSIMLLNEGVPSAFAAKHDPTFRRPVITPPFSETDRYLRIKRGDVIVKDPAKIEEVLSNLERAYDEKYGTLVVQEAADAPKKIKKKKPINLMGVRDFTTADDGSDEDVVHSETDLAVAAAFALMKQVKDRDAETPTSKLKQSIVADEVDDDDDVVAVDVVAAIPVAPPPGKAIKRNKSVSQPVENDRKVMQALDKMAKLAERADVFEAKFDSLQNQRRQSTIDAAAIAAAAATAAAAAAAAAAMKERQVSTMAPMEEEEEDDVMSEKEASAALRNLEVPQPEHPQAPASESVPTRENDIASDSKSKSKVEETNPSLAQPTQAPTSQVENAARQPDVSERAPSTQDQNRTQSPSKDELKKQLIEEKTSSVMVQLNLMVNRNEKETRLKNMIGNLFNLGREESQETTQPGEASGRSGANDAAEKPSGRYGARRK